MQEYFEPVLQKPNPYFDTIKLTIDVEEYGVIAGAEDFEYFERKNVVCIKGAEDGYNRWDAMCARLKEITVDDCKGGWELL